MSLQYTCFKGKKQHLKNISFYIIFEKEFRKNGMREIVQTGET